MKNLYIAIENKNRELNAKVLLACFAAKKGFRIVIGVNTEIKKNLPYWEPGFVLWKGLAKKGGATYKYFHANGHKAIAWCEEGLVYPDSEFYKKYRVFEEALQEVDLFFAWGKNQAHDITQKVPEEMEKVIITGNPRIDILGNKFRNVFSDDVDEIRKLHSPFILINSNFSAYTHKFGANAVISLLKKSGRINSEEDEKFYRGRSENREVVFNAFVEMIKKLSKRLPDINIILRPHSAESPVLWSERLSQLQNVKIIHQGSAMPWILASEVIIHNDCTTGLEAFLLGKPVVSYRPTAGNPYESELPIKVSKSIENTDELLMYLSRVLQGYCTDNIDTGDADVFLDQFLENYKEGDSSEKIVSILKKYSDEIMNDSLRKSTFYVDNMYRLRRLTRKLRLLISKNEKDKIFKARVKFSGLDVQEIQKIISSFNINTKLFQNLSISLVPGTQTCIRIQSSEDEKET